MSNRGVNNSNVLSGEKNHVIVVNKDDADKIREYTEALGTTSLHDSLSVLSSLETSVSQKGKAIGDLILLRHILSGEIQFKEKRLFNLFQSVIGKKFENIGKRMVKENKYQSIFKEEIEKVILKIDNNEKDISVESRPLISLMLSFIFAAGASFIPFGGIVIKKRHDLIYELLGKSDDLTKQINAVYDSMKESYYKGTTEESITLITKFKEQIKQLEEQQNIVDKEYATLISSTNFTDESITNLLLTNGNLFYPILIGLIASMKDAQNIIKFEDEIYSAAIVKLIDRFLSTNKEIQDIINSPESGSLIPEPLRNDPLGMALFFKYIKKINIEYRKGEEAKARNILLREEAKARAIILREKAKTRAELQRQRNNIETQTGTNVLNMNTFKRLNKALDDCGICLKPLAAVQMGEPIEVCENHHMFHDKCIVKWIRNSRNTLCPTCRQPILDSVRDIINNMNILENEIDEVVPGMVNNAVAPVFNNNNGVAPVFNNNNGVAPVFNNNNGVAPGMVNNANNGVVRGGRKRRTLRYKKRKSTRKNISRR